MDFRKIKRVKNPPGRGDFFEKWFKGSKVTNDFGKPLIVYHGTTSPVDFSVFQYGLVLFDDEEEFYTSTDILSFVGPHFTGSSRVASEFAFGKWTIPDYDFKGRVIPVYLSIKNPRIFDGEREFRYEVIDLAREESLDFIYDYFDEYEDSDFDSFDTEEIYDKIISIGIEGNETFIQDIVSKAVSSWIKDGYDGIFYHNDVEGGGNSYIPFDEDQIWWILSEDYPNIKE